MDGFVLTDAQWAKMEPQCLGKPTDPGRSGRNNRLFMEAVLWSVRTGSPWRDLPAMFGNWSTVFRRVRDWREADVFKRIFDAMSEEPDMEYAMIDATICLVPAFDGALFSQEWKDALWARFYTGAPARQQRSPGSSPGQASDTA